jgi:ribosomal protein L31
MKKVIHPYRQEVSVVSTDGSTYTLPMLISKSQFKLDVDLRSHPLWNEGNKIGYAESKGQLAKFHRRFKK